MKILYIIGISVIWVIVLYFFAEVYYHNHSSSSSLASNLPTTITSAKLQLREKKTKQINSTSYPHHLINLTHRYHATNILSYTPLMPISGSKTLSEVLKEESNHPINPLHPPPSTPIKPSLKSKHSTDRASKSAADYKVSKTEGIPWKEFSNLAFSPLARGDDFPIDPNLIICPKEVEDKLQERLSKEDMEWCQWALSPQGGQVSVGKSYGTLQSKDREKYEKLNCNNVAKGENPSCDDAWGDSSILYWKKNILPELCGDRSRFDSKVICRQSNSLAKFCVFENIVLDFNKMHDVKRGGRTDSRKWDKGFLSTHCDANEHADIDYYDFYAANINPDATRCHYTINETIVMYGHDDIRNLGHSMSDFMNVWAMLWLAGLGNYAKDISFLNTDAIRQGHNYYDDLGKFSRHYELQFANILRASDFSGNHKVCVKRLLFMPRPVILFTWDGWWLDMPCSFAGPSSLYQRWNLQIRQLYNLYPFPPQYLEEDKSGKINILVIKRTANSNSAGMYTSRVMKNLDEIVDRLKATFSASSSESIVKEFIVEDLSKLSFEEQVRLVSRVHLIIGVHGAGVPTSMHMSLGRPNCCGVIEIFPEGEFKAIRGYGNMARRVGHHYRRLDVNSQWSSSNGVTVPADSLVSMAKEVVEAMTTKPSCVLKSVVTDPYFDSVPISRSVMKIAR